MWPGGIGKLLIVTGLVIVIIGMAVLLFGRIGLFRLPGDIELGGRNWRVYIPITTSIILSVLLMFILWIITVFRR